MADYLLIESRDPFDSNDVGQFYGLAAGLAREGHSVTLFLVPLQERGIAADALADGVAAAALDVVIDHMADGSKTIWH
jgi:hypothetical protein